MRKKTKQWLVAISLLIIVIFLTDLLVEKHILRQISNNTEKINHQHTK